MGVGWVCHGLFLGSFQLALLLKLGWLTMADCLGTVFGLI